MHHERSLSLIPRFQGWACGPLAFLYNIPKDYLLDYFSRKFYDYVVNCLFLRFKKNSKPMRETIFKKMLYKFLTYFQKNVILILMR